MPCYGMRERVQILEGIKDINLLAAGMNEMGLVTRVIANTIAFSGVPQGTGVWLEGSYQNGKLTIKGNDPLDLDMLRKYVAKANINKQVAENNQSKYKKTKLTVKWSGFDFAITRR